VGRGLGILLCSFLSLPAIQAQSIGQAFHRLYSFDFPGAHRVLDQLESAYSDQPIFHLTRASAHLFGEMHRLGIMGTEYYVDNGKKLDQKKLDPLPEVRERLNTSLRRAVELAQSQLEAEPSSASAHFALSLASGLEANYAAFVERRRLKALPLARFAHLSALKALEADPEFSDAYLVTGLNEYVFGNLPFFARWIARFDDVKGDKRLGIERLERVASSGSFVSPLAKIMLVTIYVREKDLEEARRVAAELAAEFPDNRSFREELEKLAESRSA